ncbi:MAG: GDP-mannose 4,6-dehydratase [Clostridium sp.]|uniref:GDP-mannose 4,6-dehydratase n=1 Tax=Clostridium sp. TaxID=1506 RepID=UPI003D6D7AC6
MKKALIIGISGFVGGYLAQELMDNGVEVYGADINKGKLNDNIKFMQVNLLDQGSIINALSDVRPDYIINLAAISSVKVSWDKPDLTFDVNVKGVINLFEAVRSVNLKPRVLLIGSSEQYGKITQGERVDEEYALNALNPYGISKITQEKLAMMYKETHGIDVVLVRAFNHTGPKQNLGFVVPDFAKQIAEIEMLDKESTMYVGNLKAERDISDVRDIVRGYYALLLKGKSGEIYNIGSGTAHSMEYLLNSLVKFSSKKISVEIDEKKFRPVETPRIVCNNDKIIRDTDWKPDISMDKTLEDTFEYWREILEDRS